MKNQTKKIFRMSSAEARQLRVWIRECKTHSDNARKAAIIGFAKMFGKFLPDYTNIIIKGA